MDERIKQVKTSDVTIVDRKKLSVTGVIDVISFDDTNVVLDTDLGILTIHGQDFHINKLNVDIGEITVEGDIDSTIYEDNYARQRAGGFLTRMFK